MLSGPGRYALPFRVAVYCFPVLSYSTPLVSRCPSQSGEPLVKEKKRKKQNRSANKDNRNRAINASWCVE